MDILESLVAGLFEESVDISIMGNDGQGFSLPVLPSQFELSVSVNNSTVNINNLGDYNCIGKRGLKTIDFSSIFPATNYSWCNSTPIMSPYDYVDTLNKMAESGDYVTISISGTSINLPCLIDSFKWGENDASGDVNYTLNLKEYRLIDTNKTLSKNGLKPRKTSFLQKVAVNLHHGDDLIDSIGKAAGQTIAQNDKNKFVLKKYESAIKAGVNINHGGRVNYNTVSGIFSIGGHNV